MEYGAAACRAGRHESLESKSGTRGVDAAATRERGVEAGTRFFKISGGVLCEGAQMRYRAFQDHADRFDVRLMCRALQVWPSGYYAWLNRPECERARRNRALLVQIRAAHERSQGNYGSPRITEELKAAGTRCGKHRVARLMRVHGLRARRARQYRVTTQSNHRLPVAVNVLDRQFKVERPNEVWAADISYLWTDEGWLYLAVVLDLYSRTVIGWSMGTTLVTQLTTDALSMALFRRRPRAGLVHHSDRG